MLLHRILFCGLFMSLMTISCSTTKVLKRTTTQKYTNLIFSPEGITKRNINQTDIMIVPIDAKNLDKETFEAACRDGNYEKEFFSTIQEWENQLKTVPKQDRILIQGKIDAFEYLTRMGKEGKTPLNVVYLLKDRIANNENGKDGIENTSLLDIDDYPDTYNPYKINANYFSVFKLTFENKGSEIEKINIKEFQFVSDEEQLYPLAMDYFQDNLKNRTETMKNAYRMNMPNELIITPGQKVTKYLAIPAINPENKKLQVQDIRDKRVENYDFSVTKNVREKTYNLEEFEFGYGKEGDPTISNYFVVSYQNNVSFALKDNKLFVSDEKKTIPVSVYAIGISQYSGNLLWASASGFTFGELKKNKKRIDFYKVNNQKKK